MTHGAGSVEPGEEFTVPDDASASFLARPDVELVVSSAPASTSAGRRRQTKASAEPTIDLPTKDTALNHEEVCDVSDDH